MVLLPATVAIEEASDRGPRRDPRAREELDDWRVVFEGACAHFRTGSFAKGFALVDAIGRRDDAANPPRRRSSNRAENLRAIPRSDPDFARLYARRCDAESINRALEDTLYLNRSHSVGHLRQTADLLGFALMVNYPHACEAPRTRGRQGRGIALAASIDLFFKHGRVTPE
jgi:hypothetical protein